jgi:hypothetical protein
MSDCLTTADNSIHITMVWAATWISLSEESSYEWQNGIWHLETG